MASEVEDRILASFSEELRKTESVSPETINELLRLMRSDKKLSATSVVSLLEGDGSEGGEEAK